MRESPRHVARFAVIMSSAQRMLRLVLSAVSLEWPPMPFVPLRWGPAAIADVCGSLSLRAGMQNIKYQFSRIFAVQYLYDMCEGLLTVGPGLEGSKRKKRLAFFELNPRQWRRLSAPFWWPSRSSAAPSVL